MKSRITIQIPVPGWFSRQSAWWIPAFFFLLTVLMPNHNPGGDSWAYASAIRWGHEPVWPHHLLYVPFGRMLYLLLSPIPGVDAMNMMQVVNSLAGATGLHLFYRIARAGEVKAAGALTFLAGGTFGWMRFATENEAYIIPVTLCLAATLCLTGFFRTSWPVYLTYASFWFGMAALFHQISIFWFAGFFIVLAMSRSPQKIRLLTGYTMPFLLMVSLTYLAVWIGTLQNQSFLRFILQDVYAGHVDLEPGRRNFIMTFIGLIRSFFQVHGYQADLLRHTPGLYIVAGFSASLLLTGLYFLVRTSRRHPVSNKNMAVGLWLALLLHLCFAWYSVGNAEFMVMIPWLLILISGFYLHLDPVPLSMAGLSLLLWNGITGLWAGNHYDLDGSGQLVKKMETMTVTHWLLREPQKAENRFEYIHGPGTSEQKVLRFPETEGDRKGFSALVSRQTVVTDMIHSGVAMNRRQFLDNGWQVDHLKQNYNSQPLDTIRYLGGMMVLDRLTEKKP